MSRVSDIASIDPNSGPRTRAATGTCGTVCLTGSKLSDAIGKISPVAGHNRHTAVTVSWQFERALA